ncbi:MAG: DUF3566 domain-containing protein [Aeromicrobium sp.]
MNDEDQLPDSDTAPGSGAGDAATSQAIPHLPKPAARKPPTKKRAAKKFAATVTSADAAGELKIAKAEDTLDELIPADTEEVAVTETDKGRARKGSHPSAMPDSTPPTRAERRIEPVSSSRALTAADYARTTTPSPSTTSVIPAVKDEPAEVAEVSAPTAGSGRKANLRLNHIEPWSVARIAFAISVALMIVGVVAMTIFWVVLNLVGVWDQVNDAVTSVLSDDSSSFDITDYLGFWRLIGLTLVLSAINVVLMTALATIGAHLYNLAAQVLGGVEVTFSEDS